MFTFAHRAARAGQVRLLGAAQLRALDAHAGHRRVVARARLAVDQPLLEVLVQRVADHALACGVDNVCSNVRSINTGNNLS